MHSQKEIQDKIERLKAQLERLENDPRYSERTRMTLVPFYKKKLRELDCTLKALKKQQ